LQHVTNFDSKTIKKKLYTHEYDYGSGIFTVQSDDDYVSRLLDFATDLHHKPDRDVPLPTLALDLATSYVTSLHTEFISRLTTVRDTYHLSSISKLYGIQINILLRTYDMSTMVDYFNPANSDHFPQLKNYNPRIEINFGTGQVSLRSPRLEYIVDFGDRKLWYGSHSSFIIPFPHGFIFLSDEDYQMRVVTLACHQWRNQSEYRYDDRDNENMVCYRKVPDWMYKLQFLSLYGDVFGYDDREITPRNKNLKYLVNVLFNQVPAPPTTGPREYHTLRSYAHVNIPGFVLRVHPPMPADVLLRVFHGPMTVRVSFQRHIRHDFPDSKLIQIGMKTPYVPHRSHAIIFPLTLYGGLVSGQADDGVYIDEAQYIEELYNATRYGERRPREEKFLFCKETWEDSEVFRVLRSVVSIMRLLIDAVLPGVMERNITKIGPAVSKTRSKHVLPYLFCFADYIIHHGSQDPPTVSIITNRFATGKIPGVMYYSFAARPGNTVVSPGFQPTNYYEVFDFDDPSQFDMNVMLPCLEREMNRRRPMVIQMSYPLAAVLRVIRQQPVGDVLHVPTVSQPFRVIVRIFFADAIQPLPEALDSLRSMIPRVPDRLTIVEPPTSPRELFNLVHTPGMLMKPANLFLSRSNISQLETRLESYCSLFSSSGIVRHVTHTGTDLYVQGITNHAHLARQFNSTGSHLLSLPVPNVPYSTQCSASTEMLSYPPFPKAISLYGYAAVRTYVKNHPTITKVLDVGGRGGALYGLFQPEFYEIVDRGRQPMLHTAYNNATFDINWDFTRPFDVEARRWLGVIGGSVRDTLFVFMSVLEAHHQARPTYHDWATYFGQGGHAVLYKYPAAFQDIPPNWDLMRSSGVIIKPGVNGGYCTISTPRHPEEVPGIDVPPQLRVPVPLSAFLEEIVSRGYGITSLTVPDYTIIKALMYVATIA
jgi:hypothetical protein